MGGNGSKQTDEKKNSPPNIGSEPVREVTSRSSVIRENQLRNPHDDRQIELSWLQQNNHHHHPHLEEHSRRVTIAINRWPKDDEQGTNKKPKSFIEEYIHQ